MPQLMPIHLNEQWSYILSDDAGLLRSRHPDMRDWHPLGRIDDWRKIVLDGVAFVWFHHPIRLQPLGICAVYFLHVDAVPGSAQFFVNGKLCGKHDARKGIFANDITHLIDLEPGNVVIRLESRKIIGDQFKGIRIQPVPCDEI